MYQGRITIPAGNITNAPAGHTTANDPVMVMPISSKLPASEVNKITQSVTGYKKVQRMRELINQLPEDQLGTVMGFLQKNVIQNTGSADPRIEELTNEAGTLGSAHIAALGRYNAPYADKVGGLLTKLHTNKAAMLSALNSYEETFKSNLAQNPDSKATFMRENGTDWNQLARVYHPDIYKATLQRLAKEKLANAATK